jgi:hypothetical protein
MCCVSYLFDALVSNVLGTGRMLLQILLTVNGLLHDPARFRRSAGWFEKLYLRVSYSRVGAIACRIDGHVEPAPGPWSDRSGDFGKRRGDPQSGRSFDGEFVVANGEGFV